MGAAERSKVPLMWVPTQHMVADGLTKKMDNAKLRKAIALSSLAVAEQEPDEKELVIEHGWLTEWARWALGKGCRVNLAVGLDGFTRWLEG